MPLMSASPLRSGVEGYRRPRLSHPLWGRRPQRQAAPTRAPSQLLRWLVNNACGYDQLTGQPVLER